MHSIDREKAEHYTWGTGCDGWHLVRSETLSVIEEHMPPGTAEVVHFHRHAQQFFYLLSGRALFEIDGTEVALTARQGIHVPPGVPHRIRNRSASGLEFIVVSQPPSHGDRVVVNPDRTET